MKHSRVHNGAYTKQVAWELCELTRNSPYKRGRWTPAHLKLSDVIRRALARITLLFSSYPRQHGRITLFAAAVPYHLSDDPPSCLLYSFICMFLTFPNKRPTFLVLLTKSWTRGMDDGIPLEAVPNQLCSKHNSNESFVLPDNGKSRMFIFSGCAFTKSGRFPVQNLCFCRNKLEGLRPSYEGDCGEGVTRHMSALTTNRNQLILIIIFPNRF